jgi:hypothetical protein
VALPRRPSRRVDAAIAAALFVVSGCIGAAYVRAVVAAGGKPWFYQEQFGTSVMLACGQGYRNPDEARVPALGAFLARTTDRFSCAALPPDLPAKPLTSMQRAFRYLMTTVGTTWWIAGDVSWGSLSPLYGLLFATTIVMTYALFRIAASPPIAAALSAALTVSTLHLVYLPHLRDYSKAPFVLALLVGLAWLATGPPRPRRVLAIAAAYGVVLGVGMGFRNDLLIAFPPFVAVVLFWLPAAQPNDSSVPLAASPGPVEGVRTSGVLNRTRVATRLELKAGAIAVCAATFTVAALPMLSIYAPGGGGSMQHVMLLGLITPFNDDLGVTNGGLYEWGDQFKDEYAHAVVSSYDTRMHGRQESLDLYGPAYDRAATEYLRAVATAFPADMVVRVYASVIRVLELPYAHTSLQPPTFVTDRRIVRAYHGRERLLRLLGSIWPALIAGVLVGVTLANPRMGGLLFVLAFYFGAYPVLQFHERHCFHLEFMGWWALGLILQQALDLGLAMRDQDGRTRMRAAVVAHPWRSRIAVTVMLWIAIGSLLGGTLSAARRYQQPRVRAMFERYLTLPRDPFHLVSQPAAADVVRFDGPAKSDAVRASATSDAVHSEYLVAEFAADTCDAFKFDVTFRYQANDPFHDFSRTMQIRPPLDAGAVRRVLVPAYFHRAPNGESDSPGYGLQGIDMPASAASCLSSLARVHDVSGVALLLSLNLPPHWEEATLSHTLAGWESRRNGQESLQTYTFPTDLPLSRSVVASPVQQVSAAQIAERSSTLDIRGSDWIVDGEGGVGGRGPFLYLARMHDQFARAGALLLAEGQLDEGGVSLGLLRSGRWIAQVPVTAPGPFLIVIRAPADGNYSAVLANNLPGRSLENHVRLRRLGWVTPR